MAAITLTTMQSRVAVNCGNLPTNHKVYTDSTSLKDYINEAGRRVVLMAVIDPVTKRRRDNFEAFPELRDRVWYDVTVNTQPYLLMPSDCLVPDSITCTRVTTAYAQGSDNEFIVVEKDIDTFKLLQKSTPKGFPQIWCRSGTQLLFWPTPSSSPTNYLTQTILRGIREEQDLVNSGDTFQMDERWHPAVVDEACSLTSRALNRWDEADKWHAAAEQKIVEAVSLLGASNRKNRGRVRFAGVPQ